MTVWDTPRARASMLPAFRMVAVLLAAAIAAWSAEAVTAAGPALVLSRGSGEAETAEVSLEELAGMPQVTIVTENEFVDQPVAYRGPLARDVLARFGLGEVETVRLVAANDYFVDVPTSDFHRFDVILAMEADGARMSRRDKGPLWLMYPISDHQELRDPLYIHRLIWQVVRIEAP